MPKVIRTTITIDRELHAAGLRLARQACRKFSSEVAYLIKAEAERRGLEVAA